MVTAPPIEHPVADVLRVLAVSRSSGALEVRGGRGGTFFLHEGDITYAEALGVPPAEELGGGDPRLPSMIRSAIIEAGLTLLAEEGADGERPLFRPGRRHWSGRTCRLEVEAMLSEISEQVANFTRLGVNPDDQIQLCGLPPDRMVVLSRQQWALTAELFDPQTARTLAWRSGSSLSATIEALAPLVVAGVVERGAPIPRPLAPPAPVLTASARPARPREPEPPEGALPLRVPGATPLPSTAPRSNIPPRMPPMHDAAADSRALALRLLAGLRRL